MRKWLYAFLCSIIPSLALAADPNSGSSLSFAPPAGDYSVIFLGNLFGVVDGVLHGTGSQIMGNMFGVFNSAVLALGGIIIMYTLMVSTMNTAHEGQFLGQKWSSIWIPVRSTLGLALIIPKASGYCLMQVFVMWVVVQGIGAADKVWDTALSYLNRGGVIIKAQQGSPVTAVTSDKANPALQGAYAMLVGQVCMGVLQKQLQLTREGYLNAKSKQLGGACDDNVVKHNPDMKKFCSTPVPDFIGSVDFISAQDSPPPYQVKMPNFDSKSPYASLNGICGTIKWERFGGLDNAQCNNMAKVVSPNAPRAIKPASSSACGLLSQSESDVLAKARPIALTAMYNNLASVAQIMVNNIPIPNTGSDNGMKKIPFSGVAQEQFGVPYTAKGQICAKYTDICVGWGASAGSASSPLFSSGAEFLYAVLDYNSNMLPNLNLVEQLKNVQTATKAREFIEKANREGWIMAGSYFFDLVKLNSDAVSNNSLIDLDSGLNNSLVFKTEDLTSAFTENGCGNTEYAVICTWLNDSSKIKPLVGLINGTGYMEIVQAPVFAPRDTASVNGKQSSTINGFVQNSVLINLPGQPGTSKMQIARFPQYELFTQVQPLPQIEFDCGWVWFGCLGRALGDLFWNKMVLGIYEGFLKILSPIITSVVNTFVMIPLQAMSGIFVDGLKTLSDNPGVNPVIALANMGVKYINVASDMWLNMLMLSISTAIIPFIGKFIFALITLSMPIVIAWLSLMMGVGFITAYYIPILPFLIFTFASIGWFIAVIEAMVAAPIVALGITHPEGHDAFGKGEQAVMILMNVFLRPAMMIIGYVAAIALCYVGIWLLNAGFQHAIGFVVGIPDDVTAQMKDIVSAPSQNVGQEVQKAHMGHAANVEYGYTGWAGIYAFFFSILIYTSAYLTIVQKSFTLIHYLPDKVLRWIGGQPEGIGGETAGWTEDVKGQIKEGGEKTSNAQGKIGEKLGASAQRGIEKIKDNASKVLAAGTGGVSTATEEPPQSKSSSEQSDEKKKED